MFSRHGGAHVRHRYCLNHNVVHTGFDEAVVQTSAASKRMRIFCPA